MPRVFLIQVIFILFITSCSNNKSGSTSENANQTEEAVIDAEKIALLKIGNAEDYNQALDMLDKKDLGSIISAIKIFNNSTTDTLSRDSMLLGFNDFLAVMANSYLGNNDSLHGKTGADISEETARRMKEKLSTYGMKLSTAEGEFYLDPDKDFLIQNFGSAVSPAYREFLTISAREQKEKFVEDGTILIASDSLAKRIIVWEDFLGKYPAFLSLDNARDLYSQYMEAFLAGTDNSRVFDPISKKLNERTKKDFENFITNNPSRKSAVIVKDYYNLLKSSNFVYSEKADSFILERIFN